MHYFGSIDFRLGVILMFLIPQTFCAIFGTPEAIFKVSPTDIEGMERSKLFYRSWRILAFPLIAWIGAVIGSWAVNWFRKSDPIGNLWAYSMLYIVILGFGAYLGWRTEKRLKQGFMRRYIDNASEQDTHGNHH